MKSNPYILTATAVNWVTKKNLSNITGISERSIEHFVASGDIDLKKIGNGKNGRVLVSISSYNNFINTKKSA